MDSTGRFRKQYRVRCPRCRSKFALFSAAWCVCEPRFANRGKICPACGRCPCDLPELEDPACWIDPPRPFREAGFRRLLVYYL